MITFITTCFDFPQSVKHFFVTWAVLFFLAYSTDSCFAIIWRCGINLSSSIKVYPHGFLKITRETRNRKLVTHVRFDKQYHQFPTNFKAFCICIPCIHCICCFTVDSARTHSLFGYVDATCSKIAYFICVCFFLFVISYIMRCFGCMEEQHISHFRRFNYDNIWIEMVITPTCNPIIFFSLRFISFISFDNIFQLVWMVSIQAICLLYSHLAKEIEV